MRTAMKIRDKLNSMSDGARSGLGIIVLAALLLETASIVQYIYTRKILEEQLENNAGMTL